MKFISFLEENNVDLTNVKEEDLCIFFLAIMQFMPTYERKINPSLFVFM